MKNYLSRILGLTLLSAICAPAYSQKVITFDSKATNTTTRHHNHSSDEHKNVGKNSLSVGLISWFNGYTPIYYERAVTSFLSIQAGIGVTTRSFGNDLGFIVSGEGKNSTNFASGYEDIEDSYENYKFRKTMPGIYASFAPKLYFGDDVMDGKFVSPMVEFKQFRYQAQKADEHAPVTDNTSDDRLIPHSTEIQNESMRCIDFTVNFGGHFQSRNHLIVAWSIGTGIRNAKSERLDIGMTTDPLGERHYANAVQSYDKTKFLFLFNFIIGGWF